MTATDDDNAQAIVHVTAEAVIIPKRRLTPAEAIDLHDQLTALRDQLEEMTKPTLPQKLRELADFLDHVKPAAELYICIGGALDKPMVQVTTHGTPDRIERGIAAVDLDEAAAAYGFEADIYGAEVSRFAAVTSA